jgi:DeoR/GlpR family transcriptional regulator of sugar metabolism
VLAVERRIKVLERIAADQAVEVSSLAREFEVSEMTIRRDLRRLDRDGFVRRTYGGATTRVVRAAVAFEATQNARMLHHAQEKRRIALRAADLTAGARVMFIGVGSTVEQFARLAAPRDGLLVITQSLVVASLLGTRRVQVIMAGGMVRQDELSCVGPAAIECVQRYNTDIAVIGAAGVSARRGVTDLDDQEAAVIRAALERTERIVVLADGSKFGDVALSTVVPIKRVSAIITDSSADPVEVERIEREGVDVIITEADVPSPATDGRGTADGRETADASGTAGGPASNDRKVTNDGPAPADGAAPLAAAR